MLRRRYELVLLLEHRLLLHHLQHVRAQLVAKLILVRQLERWYMRKELELATGLLEDGHDALRLDVGQLVQRCRRRHLGCAPWNRRWRGRG